MTQPNTEQNYRTRSFWLDSIPGSLQPREALGSDLQTDVVIVGGGYTGMWTAYYLKQHAPNLDVTILEAEICGFGASGRNGGWCTSYLAGIEDQMADPRTRSDAIALQRLMNDTVAEVERVTQAEGIDCHLAHGGQIAAAILPVHLQRFWEGVEFFHGLGFTEDDIRWLDKNAVLSEVNVKGALGGYHMSHCAAIQPALLARGLADTVERLGIRILEHSPVTQFSESGVATAQGKVKANSTILACEGYSGSLPGLKRKLIPVHSTMVATQPLTDNEIEETGLKRRFNFNNGNHVTTYGQLTADKRIAFGCRGSYLFGARINQNFQAGDREFRKVEDELIRFFPVLRNTSFSHAWGGSMGVSRTLSPAVCFDSQTRLGWAGGYFGEGVGASNLAGRTMADLILSRDTERANACWVNPPAVKDLKSKLWEPEPLRWLGVSLRRNLMSWVDAAEHRNSRFAPLLNRSLEFIS